MRTINLSHKCLTCGVLWAMIHSIESHTVHEMSDSKQAAGQKPTGIFLANAAIRQAEKHASVLSVGIVRQLALGHVACWVNAQDASIQSAAIIENAQAAMARIEDHFAKVAGGQA